MLNIRSALAGALLVLGAATVASAQQPGGAARPHQGKFRNPDAMLLRGIPLSASEKSGVANVRAKYAQQTKALHEQYKPQLAGARDARQRGDTAALQGMRQTMMQVRKQEMAIRQSERADLRATLSASNQAKFDNNVAAMGKRFAKHGKPGAGRNGLSKI